MHEEHACKLHQAPSHHPCGLHIRWQRVLDTTGWDLLFRRLHNCLRRVRRAEGDPILRELHFHQRALLPGGRMETGENSTATVCQTLPSRGQPRLTDERIRGCVPVHHLHGAIPSATIHPGASAAIRRCWKHQIQPSHPVCLSWRPGRFSAVWDQRLQHVDRRGIQSESLLLGLHQTP